jgi:hypothetical protein
MRRVRQRTVEPVFGNLLQHYGLRRVGTKGRAAAHKAILLSAIAYNLKKLLKYQPNREASLALALRPAPLQVSYALFKHYWKDLTSSVDMRALEQLSSATDTVYFWRVGAIAQCAADQAKSSRVVTAAETILASG